jgi:hypothetical protein
VRIGMEKTVDQHHLEHGIGTASGQLFQIQPGRQRTFQVASGDALDALHDQQILTAVLPVNLGKRNIRIVCEVLAKTLGVTAFQCKIELAPQRFGELPHHAPQLESPRFRHLGFRQPRKMPQQSQVGFDARAHIRPTHLEHHRRAVLKLGQMHLGNGSSGDRLDLQIPENLEWRSAQRLFKLRLQHIERLGWHAVLQLGEFGNPVRREQIRTRRQYLTKLDEGRAQFLHR